MFLGKFRRGGGCFTCAGGLISQLVISLIHVKEREEFYKWVAKCIFHFPIIWTLIILKLSQTIIMVTYSLKIIKPWPFFRIMEGGMSLIKVGVMFSFPNVDPLSWGVAILLEKLAPEIRGWTSKAPFHTVYLIVSGDFMQSLSSLSISFTGNVACSLMPWLYGFVRFA